MKLHFESNLEYQQAAIQAICDLFRGQEICRSVFSVSSLSNASGKGQLGIPGVNDGSPKQLSLPGTEYVMGIGNRLQLLDVCAKL